MEMIKLTLIEFEKTLKEITGIKRAVRLEFDSTIKSKKKQKQTLEQKALEKTALKMENLALMHSFTGLNLKYTFENFVEGENSKFAYKVAKLIAQSPGESKYNPLFISGSVGVGKTHLMHSIAHYILERHANRSSLLSGIKKRSSLLYNLRNALYSLSVSLFVFSCFPRNTRYICITSGS